MDTSLENHNGFRILFILTIAASSIVLIEPAPYDILLVLLISVAVLCRYATFHSEQFWPVICLLLFLETNLVSLIFAQDYIKALYYLFVTLYCIIAWAGMMGIASYFGVKLLPLAFHTYVAAALVGVLPGIVAYSHPGGMLDMFLWEGRVQGLFKDPNVFGPFLVPPALFALWRMGKKGQRPAGTICWTLVFLLLTLGVLLSFSRAAWGQFILASGIYFLLINDATTKRMKTLFLLTIVLVPVLIYCVMATSIGDLFFDRVGMKGYDQTRFQKQEDSLTYMMAYPFGFGPGQSELFLNHSTHNLFIRTISENGLLGSIFFSLFYLMTFGRAIQMSRIAPRNSKGFFIIISASLVGVLFNSMFIDTMHWRHFWFLLALPWMHIGEEQESEECEKQMR